MKEKEDGDEQYYGINTATYPHASTPSGHPQQPTSHNKTLPKFLHKLEQTQELQETIKAKLQKATARNNQQCQLALQFKHNRGQPLELQLQTVLPLSHEDPGLHELAKQQHINILRASEDLKELRENLIVECGADQEDLELLDSITLEVDGVELENPSSQCNKGRPLGNSNLDSDPNQFHLDQDKEGDKTTLDGDGVDLGNTNLDSDSNQFCLDQDKEGDKITPAGDGVDLGNTNLDLDPNLFCLDQDKEGDKITPEGDGVDLGNTDLDLNPNLFCLDQDEEGDKITLEADGVDLGNTNLDSDPNLFCLDKNKEGDKITPEGDGVDLGNLDLDPKWVGLHQDKETYPHGLCTKEDKEDKDTSQQELKWHQIADLTCSRTRRKMI